MPLDITELANCLPVFFGSSPLELLAPVKKGQAKQKSSGPTKAVKVTNFYMKLGLPIPVDAGEGPSCEAAVQKGLDNFYPLDDTIIESKVEEAPEIGTFMSGEYWI